MLLLLFLLPPFALCTPAAEESVPTYEHQDPSTGTTLLCTKCPPGEHMVAHCTPSTPTKCAPCGEDHFTKLWNYLPRCLYCDNICYENQEVERECSATGNRVCRCKDGFYRSSEFCFKHSECEPGLGVKTEGTSKADTVCEHCSHGYFSNSSSAKEPCVKHQKCAPGQTLLLRGSTRRDAVCGTCEDLVSRGETYREFIDGFFRMRGMRRGKMRTRVRYIKRMSSSVSMRQLAEILRVTRLNSMAKDLEEILADIQQQNPDCSSI